MATWETTIPALLWLSNGSLLEVPTITKITDNKSSERTLEVNEAIKVTSDAVRDGKFLGWVSLNGKDYPVVEVGSDRYIVGAGSGSGSGVTVGDTVSDGSLSASAFTVCFFPGTLIAIPGGECEVEQLATGDLVLVGESNVVPVKWIGRQTISTLFGPADRLMPVRFAAGSLGGGQPLLPHSDLTVTTDHAMLVDGVLCEAGALVNGTTITRVPLSEFGERYTVYHVETDTHEIIFANAAPAETFVDNVSRRAFDNYAEFEALYGHPPEMKEQLYPRASNVRHLPSRIKTRLSIGGGKDSAA